MLANVKPLTVTNLLKLSPMTSNCTPISEVNSLDTQIDPQQATTRSAFYQAAIETSLPVALWRYPHTSEKQAVVDFSGAVHPTKIDFARHQSGFAFAPFVNQEGRNTLFIKASLYLNGTGHHFHPHALGKNLKAQTAFLRTYQYLAQMSAHNLPRWELPSRETNPVISTRAEFCTLVDDAIAYIKSTGIKKIVASRATETPLSKNFNPVALFEALCNKYPHAFVSLVSIPNVGTWIGASPELLLSLKVTSLQTVALAGTQARPQNIPLADIKWGQKELEEQALVSDYIRDFFHDLGRRSFAEDGPHTVSAGTVVHLKTTFTVQDSTSQMLHLANQILHRLHPTSAVCGMPKQEALSFILEKEKYNRAFYSGFLGPVNLNKESHLFVNLRCMQLKRRSALLYIGAGITEDSIPAAEWDETVLKSKTLLSVL